MPAGSGQQAISASRFSITIDGYEIASFSELEGITSEAEPNTQAGGQLPGKRQRSTITLKRGLTGDMGLWAWHEAAVAGPTTAARKSGELVMFGSDGKAVARFHLENPRVPQHARSSTRSPCFTDRRGWNSRWMLPAARTKSESETSAH